MRKIDGIVTVASWEPRFVKGLTRLLDRTHAETVVTFFYREFSDWTSGSRRAIRRLAKARQCRLQEIEITFEDPAMTWRTLNVGLTALCNTTKNVLVDITTMPRETIWGTFFWLGEQDVEIHYAYHHPASYAQTWLARDPSEPRIVFKLAGTPGLSRETALIVVTGFDVDRVSQAMDFYQPTRTVLVAQCGSQFDNVRRNIQAHNSLPTVDSVHFRQIDVFAQDHGYEHLKEIATDVANDSNILLFSFGPKTSAVALYRVQREIPESGLAFIHCKEYNRNYSQGIGATITGSLPRFERPGLGA